MKIKDIDENIKMVDFENFFNIYEDKNDIRNPYFYNLNTTVYFDGIPSDTYSLTHDMFWTTISYNIYDTTRLWWLLMKLNNVTADNLFDIVPAGTEIKYIEKTSLQPILVQLRD